MAHRLSWSNYDIGYSSLETVRCIKDSAHFFMGMFDPSFGDIPDWNENPEAYAAYSEIKVTARELEKALMNLLAVYECQEMADYPEDWEFADRRRSA